MSLTPATSAEAVIWSPSGTGRGTVMQPASTRASSTGPGSTRAGNWDLIEHLLDQDVVQAGPGPGWQDWAVRDSHPLLAPAGATLAWGRRRGLARGDGTLLASTADHGHGCH